MIDRFLDRDAAPLSADQWAELDRVVVEAARSALVGRRFIPVYGPLGPGVQTVPVHHFEGTYAGEADLTGEAECGMIKGRRVRQLAVPLIHKDFLLLWREIAAGELGLPLDPAAAASAAAFTARKEDDLIFNGDPELEMDGLLTVPGRKILGLSDWAAVGSAFADVTQAIEELGRDGYYGPYALVVPPRLYAQMHRVHEQTGVLEIRNVEELTRAGVLRSAVLPETKAAVVSVGAQNMDLAVAQDPVIAYLGPEKMNLVMRVFEMVALRIKRPSAIATLEAGHESA